MLVPHHHFQQICPRCGRLPAYSTAVCPSCGMSLALPRLGQLSGSNPRGIYPPVVVSHSPDYTPLIVEIILNVFGIYGVGWLMLGQLTGGLILLIVSLLLWPVVFLMSILTLGAGLICLGPVAIVALAINLVLLQQAVKRRAC